MWVTAFGDSTRLASFSAELARVAVAIHAAFRGYPRAVKRNHSAEVCALAEVVRAALAEVEESGRILSEPTRRAFACVERWLAGETVTKEELEQAREAAHQSHVAREQREQDQSLVWANAAVGNLAWMAQKARGWKDGERTVLDAAVYMVSSLGGDGGACRERFEALRLSTLESALVSNHLPKPPRSATPVLGSRPRRVDGELEPFIGAVASERLSTLAAIFDPTRRGDDKALRDRMKTRRYTVYEPVLAFERRYGGLVMPNALGEEDAEWFFGAYSCLSSSAHGDPRGGDAHAGAKGKRSRTRLNSPMASFSSAGRRACFASRVPLKSASSAASGALM